MGSRILYVLNDAEYFLSHRLGLAEAARAAGHNVHVATPPSPATRSITAAGFQHHPFRLERRRIGIGDVITFRSLLGLYRKLRPDLAHHLTVKPIILGGLAARVARVPAVVHAVTGLGHAFSASGASLQRRAILQGYRVASRHPNCAFIFQNPDDADAVGAACKLTAPQRVVIRGSGVDVGRFEPRQEPPGPVTVVLASRMLWTKGIGEFVSAARLLRSAGSTARFLLVGKTDHGNPAGIPESKLREWTTDGEAEWLGFADNMVGILQGAHIVCLPSFYGEGVPKVLIEAAAAGRPVVTTDTAGCREIVRHGENGLLVPPRNVDALAEALRVLIGSPALRSKMGEAGRAIATAHFSSATVHDRTLALYEHLIAHGQGASHV